jgi:hypothetical protein
MLNVTKSLLVTIKGNWLRSGTVTPLHFISGGYQKLFISIPKELCKYHVLFRKEFNELLVIRYLISSVTVPLRLLVITI